MTQKQYTQQKRDERTNRQTIRQNSNKQQRTKNKNRLSSHQACICIVAASICICCCVFKDVDNSEMFVKDFIQRRYYGSMLTCILFKGQLESVTKVLMSVRLLTSF